MIFLTPVAAARSARKSGVDRIAKMINPEEEIDLSKFGFWSLARMKGIRFALVQSELDVSVIGFFRTGGIVAVLTAAAVYIATTNLFVGMLMGAISIIVYVDWLHWRRDHKRLEYDSAIASMCDRLASGAQLNNTLLGAMSHANLSAPPQVAPDFQAAERTLTQGGSLTDAFAPLIARRNSYSLEMLVDALYTWSAKGTSVSLQTVLEPLAKTIREMSKEREAVEAELSGVRFRLLFVALAPIAYVMVVRGMMPAVDEVYNSFMGTVFLVIGFGISLSSYYLGERQMNGVRKALEIE